VPPIAPELCRRGLLLAMPNFLKRHRAGVAQGGMHSFPVVKCHPVNHLIFGLPPGFEAQAVQAFDLQRAEQGFRHRMLASLTLTGSQQLPLRLIDPRMP
jgi:hypothetical protein